MNRNFFYYLKIVFIWALYLPAVFVTYIIVWLDRKLKFPLPFPRHIAALQQQQDWCIKTLKKNGVLPADAVVSSYKVTTLNPDMIFRSNAGVIEITYSHAGETKILKCFAKFAPTMGSIWNRTIFNLQLNHVKETWFNRHFVAADKKIPSAEVYYTGMSVLTGNLCLITEFMSDCMEYGGQTNNYSEAHIYMGIEGMAKLHAACWNDTPARIKKVLPIEDNTVHLFDSIVASSWSLPARNVLVKSWCLMNARQTVLHGDARIGNMMFPKSETEGRFVFIDWQAVRQGKAAFDLAYFIVLSLNPAYRKDMEQKCLQTYHTHLLRNGIGNYSVAELEEDYHHACLCVLVLLSLPLLSGEASVEGYGAKVFAWGMNIWRERMEAKFAEFDYGWMAQQYNMSEQQAKEAVAEMLGVIKQRLERIEQTSTA